MQLEVWKSDLVDIQMENVIPPEERQDEYHYRPVPTDLIPPIGKKHMLHLYNSPQWAEVTGHLFHRIRKKIKEHLWCSDGPAIG